jgi:UDP-N-acetylglucosamine:LPS N-acetylglucosamine transferase
MGAGHDGAARGLAAQLTSAGYATDVRDFLDSGPLHIGSALRSGYEFELKHVPAAYDATYRLWYRAPWLCPLVTWIVTLLTRRKVLRWVRESQASTVVSTYPLATLCLGRLRTTGRLRVPAVNFITDFGVHPLWVHDGMDLNLAIHEGPAQMANRRTGRPAIACGPVVSSRFAPEQLPERALARQNLGLRPDQRAVLVVAGSWGVGDLRATWNAIAGDGRFTPVVVCGRDPRLHDQVSALARLHPGDSIVLGWTDDMPALMAACDALVENAGGLTSLEAMRAGLPVVSFQPIAGHGRENTAGMAAAGVSRLAGDADGLATALAALTEPGPSRDEQVSTAAAMFRADAAEIVANVAEVPAMATPARRPVLTLAKVAAALAATASLGWAGLTSGVALAAEAGAGVAHPVGDEPDVAYIGVRLDSAELSDPGVVGELQNMNVTAVVDDATALANVTAVRDLVHRGVNVENGGYGDLTGAHHDSDSLPWTRAQHDAKAGYELGLLIGQPVTVTVPGRRVNAFDLIECRKAHTSLVVPNHILDPAASGEVETVIHLSPRRIYLINGLGATPAQLSAYLSQVSSSLRSAHLSATPLAALA